MKDRKMKRVKLGQHIVADPEICHGAPTFVGTRIMVDHVLEMVAAGTAWDEIIAEYDRAITRARIAEAVRLARRSFSEKIAARRTPGDEGSDGDRSFASQFAAVHFLYS